MVGVGSESGRSDFSVELHIIPSGQLSPTTSHHLDGSVDNTGNSWSIFKSNAAVTGYTIKRQTTFYKPPEYHFQAVLACIKALGFSLVKETANCTAFSCTGSGFDQSKCPVLRTLRAYQFSLIDASFSSCSKHIIVDVYSNNMRLSITIYIHPLIHIFLHSSPNNKFTYLR